MSLNFRRLSVLGALTATAAAVIMTQSAAARTAPAHRAAKKWEVKMGVTGNMYVFEPKELTIQAGDTVKWIAVNGSHNISFWPDSVPAGAPDVIRKALPDTLSPGEPQYAPLSTKRRPTMGDSIVVVFAGFPKGVYKYNCKPHLMRGMVAQLTIQ